MKLITKIGLVLPLLFVTSATAQFPQQESKTKLNTIIESSDSQELDSMNEMDLAKFQSKWIVTSVERDGEVIKAQFGQQVGDVIDFKEVARLAAADNVTTGFTAIREVITT